MTDAAMNKPAFAAGRTTNRRGSRGRVPALLLAATAFAAGFALPASAETALSTPTVETCAQLLEAGRFVEAREHLATLLDARTGDASGAGLSDEQRAEAYKLLAQAVGAASKASPMAVALQEAEFELSRSSFNAAERKTREALRMAKDAGEQPPVEALDLLASITRARAAAEWSTDDVAGDSSTMLASAMQADVRRQDSGDGEAEASDAQADGQVDAQDEDLVIQAQRFEAQSVFAEARRDFGEGRYASARDKYRRVLGELRAYISQGQAEEAQDRLAEAEIRLQGARPGADILADSQARQQLAKQQTQAEFDNELNQAQQALASGDVQRARDLAFSARLTLSRARNYFSDTEFENLDNLVNQTLNSIDDAENRIRTQERLDREDEIAERQAEQERTRAQQREQQIAESIDRVRALQAERKYREALEVVNQILFLDPIHPAGLLLKNMLRDAIVYEEYYAAGNEIERRIQEITLENIKSQVPPLNNVDYPPDWPELSHRRYTNAAQDEPIENRRILSALAERRVPIAFNNNPLTDVVEFVRAVTNLDINVDWEALEEISIDRDTPVSLNLNNAPVNVVLDRVMEKVSAAGFGEAADWAVIDGVLTISSDANIRRNTTLEIYDIRDLVVEVPDYDDAPELDLNQALQASQGGGGGQSPFQETGDDDVERVPLEERIQQMIDIITTNVDFEGWQDNGGDTGSISQLNGQLLIRNTPKNHRAIRSLLSKLRAAQALQVNVESRFLIVDQNFFEQIGFDLDIYFNVNNNQVRAAQATNPNLTASDFFGFGSTAAAGQGLQSQVGNTQTVFVDANNDGLADLDGDGNPITTTTTGFATRPPDDGFSPVSAAGNTLGIAELLADGSSFATNILGAAPALGVAGQFLDDIQVDFLVQATQADQRNVTLTAPRLTMTNGQSSNIYFVTQQTYVSDLQPIVSDSAVGFDPELDVVSEGVVLDVTGTVSADRRYVTLDINTGIAEIVDFASQEITAVAGGQLVSSADTGSAIQLPQVTVTRVATTVTVPDQGTVLLGGQRVITETEVESGVPVLSKIPVISRFFSNRIEAKEERTLLILVKPTILIQNEEEERAYPGLLGDLASEYGN